MRSKSILSIAAFIIAFTFSTAFAGLFIAESTYQTALTVPPVVSYEQRKPTSCFTKRSRYVADKITVFISQDDSNGRDHQQINARIEREGKPVLKSQIFSEYQTSVAEYVEASENMDETAMPQEFQDAWRAHLQAWRDYDTFLDSLKNSQARAEFTDSEARQAEAPFNAEIAATYEEVLRAGRILRR
jgi:hypothetical protein